MLKKLRKYLMNKLRFSATFEEYHTMLLERLKDGKK